MKKVFYLIYLISVSVLGQNKPEIEKSEELMKLVNVDLVLTNAKHIWEDQILSQTDSLLKSNGINIKDTINTNEFKQKVKKSISDFSVLAGSYIYRSYLEYDTKKLDDFLTIARSTISLTDKLTQTDFHKLFLQFVSENQTDLDNKIINIIDEVKANEYPLKLDLFINNIQITDLKKIDLDLYFFSSNEKYKKISVLNKSNGNIEFPKDLKNEELLYLTISYKGKEIEMYNPRINELYQNEAFKSLASYKEIVEMTDALPVKCFEETTKWIIGIIENPDLLKDINFKEDYGIEEKVKSFIFVKICSETFAVNKL